MYMYIVVKCFCETGEANDFTYIYIKCETDKFSVAQ